MSTVPTTGRVRRPVVILRPVPGSSVVHRMWAGTKLIAVAAMAAVIAVFPLWPAIAAVALLAGIAVALARIPRTALPSIPGWVWLTAVAALAIASLAGGSPVVTIGSVELPLGGLLDTLRFAAISVVLLGAGALISWTTHIADIAPAIAVLGCPLRRLGVPTDDWAAAIALGLRALPMLVSEFRTMFAARRLRPRPVLEGWRMRGRWWISESIDVLAVAITVALRRADEMGDAITARGGAGQISAAPSRPRLLDWLTMTAVLAVCGGTAVGEFLAVGLT
jgi:energy-coupling factor transport system permease protein